MTKTQQKISVGMRFYSWIFFAFLYLDNLYTYEKKQGIDIKGK